MRDHLAASPCRDASEALPCAVHEALKLGLGVAPPLEEGRVAPGRLLGLTERLEELGPSELSGGIAREVHHQYLSVLISNGTSLKGRWREGWVGEWNLGSVDKFIPSNYEGASGKRDLFVHNTNWFGMMRAIPTPLRRLPAVTTAIPAGEPVEEAVGAGVGEAGPVEEGFAAAGVEPVPAGQEAAGGVATATEAAPATAVATTAITSPILVFGEPNLTLQRLYYRWIHNYRYGRNW